MQIKSLFDVNREIGNCLILGWKTGLVFVYYVFEMKLMDQFLWFKAELLTKLSIL